MIGRHDPVSLFPAIRLDDIDRPTISDDICALGPSRRNRGQGRARLLFLSQFAEVLKVAVRHVCDVLAAEDTSFETLHLAVSIGRLHASRFEIFQALEHNTIGIDIFANLFP